MNRNSLEQHIRGFKLGQFGDELIRSARRALRLRVGGSDVRENGSRFGGLPYGPRGFSWPMTSAAINPKRPFYEAHQYVEGPLRFICQINLAEVPYTPDALDLREGLLLFFAATHKADFPRTDCVGEDWLVLHATSEGGGLLEPPPLGSAFVEALDMYSDSPVKDGSIILNQFEMLFEEIWLTNPVLLYGRTDIPTEVDARLADMPNHLLGGYANYMQSPVEEAAAAYRKVSTRLIEPIAQFDSDLTLGLNWSGGARAYFVAPKVGGAVDLEKSVLVTQI